VEDERHIAQSTAECGCEWKCAFEPAEAVASLCMMRV